MRDMDDDSTPLAVAAMLLMLIGLALFSGSANWMPILRVALGLFLTLLLILLIMGGLRSKP